MQSGSPWRTVAVPRTSRCGARGIASRLKAEVEYASNRWVKRRATTCAAVGAPRTPRCGARGIASGLKAEAEYATEPRAKRHTTACAVALAVVPRVRRVLHRPGNTSREFRSRQATRYLLASGRNCCCRADYRCRCNIHPSKFHNSDLSAACRVMNKHCTYPFHRLFKGSASLALSVLAS